MIEQLVPAGTRGEEVDGGGEPLFRKIAIEAQLHVSGALELLENYVVHPALCFHESGGENRKTAALFRIASRSEELLRLDQSLRIDPARHDSSLVRLKIVVPTGEAG